MKINFNQYFDLRDESTIRLIADDMPSCSNDGYLIKSFGQSVSPVKAVVTNDICICSCPFELKVFAESVYTSNWKNDKTSMLFRKLSSTDTIEIKLCNDEIYLEEVISDNTYGAYYSTFSTQSLQVGFVCDWDKVFNLISSGKYYFKITKTILGETIITNSVTYNLQEYSDEKAEGTFRVDSWQTGNVKNKDVIYSNLLTSGWFNSIRLDGRLMNKTGQYETDNYYNSVDALVQIQDKINYEYQLITELINVDIADMLIEDMFLGNKILISDYNVYSEMQIKEISLSFAGIDEKKTFIHNPNSAYKFKFKPRLDNIIKYNH